MSDETRTAFTFSNFLVALCHRIYVYKVVIGSNGKVLAIRGVFQLMDDFFAILYVVNFWQIPIELNKAKLMILLSTSQQLSGTLTKYLLTLKRLVGWLVG